MLFMKIFILNQKISFYCRMKQKNRRIIIFFILMQQDEEKIRAENKELRHMIEGYLEQIDKLKQTNEQHEKEIDTLLKFNERLLTIIQTQLNQYNSRKSERSLSLQPISEITERDSDMAESVTPIKNSMLKPRFQQDPAKSDYGRGPQDLILGNNKEELHSIDASKSDYEPEPSDKMRQVLSLITSYRKQYGNSVNEYQSMRKKMKNDLESRNQQIHQLNDTNVNFYNQKMSEVQSLKQKVNSEAPERHLEQIIKSNQYSAETQNKLMKIMNNFK